MSQTFYPSGFCIYCFSGLFDPLVPDSKLTDEHIIPAAIGGTIVLEEASCKACKDTIDIFESRLHGILYPLSRRLELGRKAGKAKKAGRSLRKLSMARNSQGLSNLTTFQQTSRFIDFTKFPECLQIEI